MINLKKIDNVSSKYHQKRSCTIQTQHRTLRSTLHWTYIAHQLTYKTRVTFIGRGNAHIQTHTLTHMRKHILYMIKSININSLTSAHLYTLQITDPRVSQLIHDINIPYTIQLLARWIMSLLDTTGSIGLRLRATTSSIGLRLHLTQHAQQAARRRDAVDADRAVRHTHTHISIISVISISCSRSQHCRKKTNVSCYFFNNCQTSTSLACSTVRKCGVPHTFIILSTTHYSCKYINV